MGKYDRASYRTPPPARPWTIHPVWRGIGCIWLLISPVLAYAIASLLVDFNLKNGFIPFPFDLTRSVTIPLARLFPVNDLVAPRLYGNLLVAAVLLLVGFGVVMVIYAIIYSTMGPSRLGPMDAPPIRRKTRRSR